MTTNRDAARDYLAALTDRELAAFVQGARATSAPRTPREAITAENRKLAGLLETVDANGHQSAPMEGEAR